MQFHDEAHVRQAMLVFLLQARRPSETPLLSRDSIRYNPDGVTINPVLEKIVNSIWFYITNSSTAKSGINNILPLPDPLRNLCPCKSGHYLDCDRLGNCLALIREAPDHEMIIESEYMIKDLVWWLWYHFPGSLRVVVAAGIVAERSTGRDDSRIIEMRVGRACLRERNLVDDGLGRSGKCQLRMYARVGGNMRDILQGLSYPVKTGEKPGRVRADLYDIYRASTTHDPHNNLFNVNEPNIRKVTKSVAIKIVSWLLKVPLLQTVNNAFDFAFVVDLQSLHSGVSEVTGDPNAAVPRRMMDLLARSPSIFNRGWDIQTDLCSPIMFARPSESANDQGNMNKVGQPTEHGRVTSITDFEVVLRYFPILKDLAAYVKVFCKCMRCRQESQWKTPRGAIFDEGCLQNKVLMETLQLVAHAVADSFGCDDASAPTTKATDMGVLALLSSIARGEARWNDWFGVASGVFLGCGDRLHTQGPGNAPTTVRLAVQYGGIATIAPWLDISADLSRIKPFTMHMMQGRMGFLRGGHTAGDEGHQQLQSVEGHFAVIKAEGTQHVEPQMDALVDSQTAPVCTVPRDNTGVVCDTDMVLLQAEDRDGYILWLRASTNAYSRFIDPSSAIRALHGALQGQHECPHPMDDDAALADKPLLRGVNQARSFNDVLGLWGPGSTICETSMAGITSDMVFRYSPLCESHSWFNVALALTADNPRCLSGRRACLACRALERRSLHEDARERSGGRSCGFVISASDEMIESGMRDSERAIEWR
jgi:hypothetical protein